MKLIVGLGNPGRKYQNTNHNIGYIVLDNYLEKVKFKKAFDADIYETEIENKKVLFVKPLTYMNLSGISVKKIVDYYRINIDDILIIQDDIDELPGNYKLKRNSSSGGHNGIKSIIKELDTDKFLRLKIGVGKDDRIPTDKYVLSKISKDNMKSIRNNFEVFNSIISDFINYDIETVLRNHSQK